MRAILPAPAPFEAAVEPERTQPRSTDIGGSFMSRPRYLGGRSACVLLALMLAALAAASPAPAQEQPERFGFSPAECRAHLPRELPPNVPYDGRFTFVRINFEDDGGSGGGLSSLWDRGGRRGWGRWGGGMPGWSHDYPCAELNFMSILDEITALRLMRDGGNILTLEDPELFKYPVAYISEPGDWLPTEEEVELLRAYLVKGGFAIFDDFDGRDWYNFAEQIGRVLPEGELIPLDLAHPVFHTFFEVESLDFWGEGYRDGNPEYYGIFEDNDPTGRLMVVVNYNNDIGDYWEYAHTGFDPVPVTNEAFKLGVNYIVYALTH